MTKFEEFENIVEKLRSPEGCPLGQRADTFQP